MHCKLAPIFLLLLLPLSTAYWAETISVHVITTSSYPVPDEPVYINYQRQVSIDSSLSVAVTRGTGVTSANCQASPVTVSEIIMKTATYPNGTEYYTGEVEAVIREGTGNCQIGAGYIEPGNNTPPGLSPSALGVSGPWSVVVSEKEVDLRRLDGLVLGRTSDDGIFQIGLIDYVSFGEVDEYLVTVGKESRRVNVGDNWDGTKHVEVFVLDASIRRIVLRVLDGDGRSLGNASVVATCDGDVSQGTTTPGGIFSFYTKTPITCQASMAYGQITHTEFMHNIEEDMTVSTEIPLYDLDLRVVDDNGFPLRATVTVSGFPSNSTDDSGRFFIRRFPAPTAQVSIVQGNRQQVVQVELRSSSPTAITFDLTPPSITQVNHTLDESGMARVRAVVRDPGATPSSISVVSLRYSTNKRKWTSLPMHPVSAVEYETTIPAQEPGTTIYYVIEALDDRSNKALSPEYSYLVPEEPTGDGGLQLPQLGGVNILGFQMDLYVAIPLMVVLAIILFRLRSR